MHTPPDPDRPVPPSPDGPAAAPASGSTGEYPPPAAGSSLVTLFGSSFARRTPPANSDDAPTVITQPKKDAPKPDLAGQVLGHFELIESIGAGGMATVLKARDLELGRVVALKILPPDTAADPEVITRFKQEARAAAKLDHDNVARVYFCGEDRGLHFIAFEFVEGENLRQRIDRDGPVSPADAVRLMQQVTAGLGHAAERGVVHRDIKPSNILLTPDGRAKIVDMGLARHLESHSVNGGVTQSGITLGTFDYISPEQAMDPRRADVRSDIYSLGCAFYHALTGRPPVPEGTAAKKLHAHQYDSPVDPRDLNPQVPDALAVVLGKMMAKDPSRRHQTPAELTGELSAVAVSLGLSDPTPTDPSQPSAVLTREPPRLPAGLIAAAVAVAVAAAVLVGTTGNNAPPTPPPWADPPPVAKTVPDPITPIPNGPAVETTRRPVVVQNNTELAAALSRGGEAVTLHLVPGQVYDLRPLAGAVFAGGELVIEPAAGGEADARPEVWVMAGPPDGLRPGGLTIKSARKVTLRGFDLRVDVPNLADEADDPVGLVVAADRLECELLGVRTTQAARMVQGLVGLAADVKPTAVAAKSCLFDVGPRGVGLRLAGRAAADVSESGFGPHAVAIRTTAGDEPGEGGRLMLSHCTFMLERGGAAIEAEPGAGGRVAAVGSVFAAVQASADKDMMPGDEREAKPAAARWLDPAADGRLFDHPTGLPNAYFGTDPPAFDLSAVALTRPPWHTRGPVSLLAGGEAWRAFQLAILSDRRLQAADDPARVLGARLLRGRTEPALIYVGKDFPAWPPEKPRPRLTAGPDERVVLADAEPEDAARFRVYPDFASAFAELRPGETLVLAVDGRVPVPAGLRAKAPGLNVMIRPHADNRPVLVPEGRATRPTDALFTLSDGELRFHDLPILLRDRQGERPALVRLAGGSGVEFVGCTITLGGPDDEPGAAVVLPDPAVEMMRNGSAEPAAGPRVRFERTLIRGTGRGVWVQSPRPFRLAVDQSAAVLDGPFLSLDGGPKETSGPGPRAEVTLTRFTAVLAGPLLDIHANRAAPTLPAVTADRCLFAPFPKAASPLVRVEDADPAAEPVAYLSWSAASGSVFDWSATAPVLELRPVADAPATEWAFTAWQAKLARLDRRLPVTFAGGDDLSARRAAEVTRDDLRASDDNNRRILAGANTSKLPPDHERE